MALDLAKSLYAKFDENLPHLAMALIILILGWWLAGRVKGLTAIFCGLLLTK